MIGQKHIPVLAEEINDFFKPEEGGVLLDGTLGLGGHSALFLQANERNCSIGFDADTQAISQAKKNLELYQDRVRYVHDSFANVEDHVTSHEYTHVLLDLGFGSHQIDDSSRGFSFTSEGNLQMRYGEVSAMPEAQIEALNTLERRLQRYPDVADVIAYFSAEELGQLIKHYGEERYAWRIARAIHENKEDITSASELASVIEHNVPGKYTHGKIHPATRTFQALRIAVNRELESLQFALPRMLDLLAPGGKLAVISFHSLEDRIVKRFLRYEATDCICPITEPVCICDHRARVELPNKKPIMATEEEIQQNPRSRSAKLRLAKKIINTNINQKQTYDSQHSTTSSSST